MVLTTPPVFPMTKKEAVPFDKVGPILQGYADKAVFRGFNQGKPHSGRAVHKILWHRDQVFELVMDTRRKTLHIPLLLPKVPPRSEMYREFQRFLRDCAAASVPEHRRIDPCKARITCANRRGNVSLTLTVRGGEYEYAARKMIQLVHEVFLIFLLPYFDWECEVYDLDPDHP
jgi:hypothetical protein